MNSEFYTARVINLRRQLNGLGLHSYGFMDAAFKWLMAFVGSQILIIALGLLPLHLWASFRGRVTAPAREDAARRKPVPVPAGS